MAGSDRSLFVAALFSASVLAAAIVGLAACSDDGANEREDAAGVDVGADGAMR